MGLLFRFLDPCAPGTQGEKEWDTIRDLPKVWRSPVIRRAGFDASNTVVFDAEPRKVRRAGGASWNPT